MQKHFIVPNSQTCAFHFKYFNDFNLLNWLFFKLIFVFSHFFLRCVVLLLKLNTFSSLSLATFTEINIVNAGLLSVSEYFYSLVLVLLLYPFET